MRWALVNPTTLVVDNVPDMLTIQLEPDERCAPGWTYDPAPMASPRFLEPTEG